MLAYSSSTTAATISRPSCEPALARSAARHRSSRRRRPSCPAIRGRTADRRRISGVERRGHPVDADGIDVTAEHQRASRRASVEHADDIGPSRRDVLHVRRRALRAACARRRGRDLRLRPRAPGTSDGFTESMATRSRRREMAGSMSVSRVRAVTVGSNIVGQSHEAREGVELVAVAVDVARG